LSRDNFGLTPTAIDPILHPLGWSGCDVTSLLERSMPTPLYV
jgi:hypothetical protein